MLREPAKVALIGSGCSVATEPTAEVSQFYNLTQVKVLVLNLAMLLYQPTKCEQQCIPVCTVHIICKASGVDKPIIFGGMALHTTDISSV